MLTLDRLNANQRKAVLWDDGPLLVLAGPGSGKTAVLTLRVARLLRADPEAQVLALTFTTKAAAEMRERVDTLMGEKVRRTHLCTFHSFASDILRQHGSHLGLRPDFALVTQEQDRLAILDGAIDALDSSASAELPSDRKNILRLVDRLFAESYAGSGSAPGMRHTPSWLSPLFRSYCADLVTGNRLDFGSLLHFARVVLEEKPRVRRLLAVSWSHVCVDEFQDTNKAQYDLMKLVVPDQAPNLFVVGDDDQIIYQWNGASPERLQAIRSDYQMPVVQLPENFRCPAEIIELANRLIKHNSLRTADKQPLTTTRLVADDDAVIRGFGERDEYTEAGRVAQDILERGVDPAACTVLARTARLLKIVSKALNDAGVPAYVPVRKTDFEALEAKAAFSMLRLANARHDGEALRRACVAWSSFSDQGIEVLDIEGEATLLGGDYFRALLDAGDSDALEPRASRMAGLARTLLLERLDVLGFVEGLLGEESDGTEDELFIEEAETWRELHDELIAEFGRGSVTLHLYLQEMDLRSKAPAAPKGAVRCLTIHGSKGLEFPHVYLVGMADEVCPSWQSVKKGDTSREMEEERRNCFVAITRVQETLTLTLAHSYNNWGKRRSRFLYEMGLIDPDE